MKIPRGQEARGSERYDHEHVPVDQLAFSVEELVPSSREGCGMVCALYGDLRPRAHECEAVEYSSYSN